MREIIFDLETTGLDPKTGHRIVEIGCVELINRKVTGQYFHSYVNPERDVPKVAEKVHGLSTEFLKDKPIFKDVVNDFISFIGKDKLVIHNAAFDMGFINHHLEEIKQKTIDPSRAIDTLEIARKKFPGAKATLDALCTRFNISLERRDKHGALLDANLLAEVYIQLVGGAQGLLNFISMDNEITSTKTRKPYREPRKFSLTEEELELHNNFIKKLKK